jgi:hypothetical protein
MSTVFLDPEVLSEREGNTVRDEARVGGPSSSQKPEKIDIVIMPAFFPLLRPSSLVVYDPD